MTVVPTTYLFEMESRRVDIETSFLSDLAPATCRREEAG